MVVRVSDNGGDFVTLDGSGINTDLPLEVYVVDDDGEEHGPCYSGVFGRGRTPMTPVATQISFVVPPLPIGGPYNVKIYEGGVETAQIDAAILVVNRSWHSSVFDLRSLFPPRWLVGSSIELIDALPILEDEDYMLAYKTANDTKTTDAALALDDELFLDVVEGQKYAFHAMLFVEVESANPGFKADLGGTATLAVTNAISREQLPADGELNIADGTTSFDKLLDTGVHVVELEGSFEVTASGTIGIRWAQSASHADDTILKRGSTFRVERVRA